MRGRPASHRRPRNSGFALRADAHVIRRGEDGRDRLRALRGIDPELGGAGVDRAEAGFGGDAEDDHAG